jgi:uncharacterized membrane protein
MDTGDIKMKSYELLTLMVLGLFILIAWIVNCYTIKADGNYLALTITTIAGLFLYGTGRLHEKKIQKRSK